MSEPFTKNQLANGLTLISYPNASLHRCTIGAYFKGGIAYEDKAHVGITHMLEHLHFRNLNGLGQHDLYRETESQGSTLRGTTYADFMNFSISSSPDHFLSSFTIIERPFHFQNWSLADYKKEMAVVKKQISSAAIPTFSKLAERHYYKGTPSGRRIMGTAASLSRISLPAIEHWRKIIINPSNTCIVLTGNFDPKEHLQVVERLECIGASATCREFKMPIPRDFQMRSPKSDRFLEVDSNQSDVCIMFDVPDSDLFSAEILCSILGQGDGALISLALREEMALTDEIAVDVDLYENHGRMFFEFTVDTSDLEIALEKISELMAQVRCGISDQLLQQSLSFFTQNQFWLLDDPPELNFLLGWRLFILGQRFTDIFSLAQCYAALTVDRLTEAANSILTRQNVTVVMSHDTSIMKKSVARSIINGFRNRLGD